MKKKKGMIWSLVIVLAVLVLSVAGYATYIYFTEKDIVTTEERYAALAEEYEEITFSESTGMLYINNEIVVMANKSARESDIRSLAGEYEAEIADFDSDLGVYLLRFSKKMSISTIESLAAELKEHSIVDDAFVNPVIDSSVDISPVYPNDPWNKDKWTMSSPSGENWGMEAIDAPGAWAYLDQLSPVNVGVFDTYVTTQHKDLDITALWTVYDKGSSYYKTTEEEVTPGQAGDHGCHVAGIIGAKWNNSVGVSGVMGNKVRMYSSNVHSYGTGSNAYLEGYYSAYDYVKAIKALTDRGVRAINISQNTCRLVGFAASRGNENAINLLEAQATIAGRMLERVIDNAKAEGNDFVICVSAGNSNSTVYYKDEEATYGYVEKRGYNLSLEPDYGNSEAKYNNFIALIDEPEVKNRIIVVGSVGRNEDRHGNLLTEKYVYSEYSCVGDRVDVVAPGDDVYSLTTDDYALMSGTSMATPHVTGVAGLAFAANPSLSGPEVKNMITGLATGRYYYGSNYSGLVNAKNVVEYALATKTGQNTPIAGNKAGLDLCFLIDTTGSMGDDIDNAKENMVEILEKLSKKTPNYRVAIIDYRDFPQRSYSVDYPAKVQLGFTSDNAAIQTAIQELTLGNGGDNKETVYSAIHEALKLSWRPNAQKILIILGDAAPLDPEPYTGYTYEDVVRALYNANIGIDKDNSDDRVLGDPEMSAVSVFTIGIGSDAADFFEDISGDTGGAYTEVSNADQVTDAIIQSIEKIDVNASEILADFGEKYSGETVYLYNDKGEYIFSFKLDEKGKMPLANMEAGDYTWTIERLAKGGELRISADSNKARINEDDSKWYSFVNVVWHRHKVLLIGSVLLIVVVLIVILILRKKFKKKAKKEPKQIECGDVQVPESAPVQQMEPVVPVVPVAPKVLFCPNCGTKAEDGNKFCAGCGHPLQ